MSTKSDKEGDDDVVAFTGVVGVIWHISAVQAVVSVTHPFNAVVLFDSTAYGSGVYTNLLATGLRRGDFVVMDASLSPDEGNNVFRAYRVARSDIIVPSLPLEPLTADSSIIEVEGVVENVGAAYGFIVFGPDLKEHAFFHVKDVRSDKNKSRLGKLSLPDLLKPGDVVRLGVRQSDKPSRKAKWKATAVYV